MHVLARSIDDLTSVDKTSITSLDILSTMTLPTLDLIEYPNLRSLDLSSFLYDGNGGITNLSKLTFLESLNVKLTAINMVNGNYEHIDIVDLNDVYRLTNLKKLTINRGGVRLKKNQLVGMSSLKNLEYICVSLNGLSELPRSVWQLPKLQTLRISRATYDKVEINLNYLEESAIKNFHFDVDKDTYHRISLCNGRYTHRTDRNLVSKTVKEAFQTSKTPFNIPGFGVPRWTSLVMALIVRERGRRNICWY